MDSVTVTRTRQVLRDSRIVEDQRVDVGVGRAAAHLLERQDGLAEAGLLSAVETDDGASFGGGGEDVAILGEGHRFDCVVVGFEHVVAVMRVVEGNAHEALLTRRCHQDRGILAIRVERAEAFRVIAGVYCVDQAQIRKVVHIDSVFKHHHNSAKLK